MVCGNCQAPHLRIVRSERTGKRIGEECCFCGWLHIYDDEEEDIKRSPLCSTS